MQALETPLHRLDNATLGDRASAALLDYIRSQQLQPGSGLPSEAKLTELLGVSRPVVREALRNLRGLGVIEIHNGRGAVVRELNPASLEVFFSHALQTISNSVIALMELRTGLECEAASLAALRHSEDDAASMQSILSQMATSTAQPDRYSELDVELHLAISRASGNLLYMHLIESIRAAMRDASLRGMRLWMDHEGAAIVQALHEEIVSAIVRRDPEAAFEAMKRHMLSATGEFERQKQSADSPAR